MGAEKLFGNEIDKFVALEKRKAEYKEWLAELQSATQELADKFGVNGYFQDSEGTVYKIVVPEGKYVHFERIGYQRTRRPGEKHGDLSLKEARELGFQVE